MNISLFSPTLVLIIFGLLICLSIYLIAKIDLKFRFKVLALMVICAILLSLSIEYLVAKITQSNNELPARFWIMIFPWSFSIFILPGILFTRLYIKKHTKPKRGRKKAVVDQVIKARYLAVYSSLNFVFCLAFVLLLTNSYYHYYPTLATVLDIGTSRSTVLSQESKIVLQYNGSSAKSNTIESAIYNTNPATDNGKLYSFDIPGKISKFKTRSGYLYVPSIAFNSTSLVKLPVLIMLPGTPGVTQNMLFGAGLNIALAQLAKAHHGITPLVYVADDNGAVFNDTECVNSPSKGNAETYLTVDVPNYIKSHFNVSDNPDNWAIGGISMGGMCGIMLTLMHPNVYHYFVDIGGQSGPQLGTGSAQQTINVLFDGSTKEYNLHEPLYLLEHNKYSGIGGFFGNGNSDDPDVVAGITQLYGITKKDGFNVIQETVNGGHTFNIFSELVKGAVPWISNRIGATECTYTLACQ